MKTTARLLAIVIVSGALAACASVGIGDIISVGTAAKQASDAQQTEFTPEQEYYIGRAVAANLLSTRKVWDDQKATTYLNVLERTLSLFSDRPETFGGYHLLILDTDEINAFAAPGGLILVTRGLLRCATTEDGVAAILAHETSHVVLKHGLNAIAQSRKTAAFKNFGVALLSAFGSPEVRQLTDIFKDSVGDIVNTMANSGYSRELEFQADQMALVIMRRAGYNPQAFDDMLKLMETKVKSGGPGFGKTHPEPKDRADAVEKSLAGQPQVVTPQAAANARQARYQAALGTI